MEITFLGTVLPCAIYLTGWFILTMIADLQENHDGYWEVNGEKSKGYMHLLYWLGIKPYSLKKDEHKYIESHNKTRFKYSYGWVSIWPIVFVASIAKAIWLLFRAIKEATVGKAIKEVEYIQEQKRRYIKPEDVVMYQPGDLVVMKNGAEIKIMKFTQYEFCDAYENVYDWLDAKLNSSHEIRKIISNKINKYKAFSERADTFLTQVKDFQKELRQQQTQVFDKFHSDANEMQKKLLKQSDLVNSRNTIK